MEELAQENIRNDECLELKNIKYKTMLLSGAPLQETKSSNDLSNLDKFLENEKNNSKHEPWCKLDKTIKTKKMFEYVETYTKEKNLNEEETKLLYPTALYSVARNQLMGVKKNNIELDLDMSVIEKRINKEFSNKKLDEKEKTIYHYLKHSKIHLQFAPIYEQN
jgi:hypothetical protein